MHLTVALVEGASYSAAASSLPLLYRVVFEKETTISGPMRVTACILENLGNKELIVGYVRSIFCLPGIKQSVPAETVVALSVDPLEHEANPIGLIPGEYELSAKVSVQVSKQDGSLQHHELRATRQLVLL